MMMFWRSKTVYYNAQNSTINNLETVFRGSIKSPKYGKLMKFHLTLTQGKRSK